MLFTTSDCYITLFLFQNYRQIFYPTKITSQSFRYLLKSKDANYKNASMKISNIHKIISIFFILVLNVGCRKTQIRVSSDITSAHADVDRVETLELPILPSSLVSSDEKAAFITLHFWDNLNFKDSLRTHDNNFMEQNFSNFINILPFCQLPDQSLAVKNLIKKAEVDKETYLLLADIAKRYLYDPNSPFLSEEIYEYFVEDYLTSTIFDEAELSRYKSIYEDLQKNHVGNKASDFTFTTKDGNPHSLYTFACDKPILLIFYDPECESCDETISSLKRSQKLKEYISHENLEVLAVYSGENKEKWLEKYDSLPTDWTIGYDPGIIEANDIYILRAMPTLYLLDPDKIVFKKDISPEFFK